MPIRRLRANQDSALRDTAQAYLEIIDVGDTVAPHLTISTL
jgi:hypothetical protein